MKEQKIQWRKVKRGSAKDYQRGAKLFDYYYIRVKNQDHNIDWNGWDMGNPTHVDKIGRYVVIDGVQYYLEF